MLRALFTLTCLALLAPSSQAQELDGKWFKLKVKAQGLAVRAIFEPEQLLGGVPAELGKASFKTTAYMLLELVEPKPAEGESSTVVYDVITISEVAPEVFDIAFDGPITVINDELSADGFQGYVTPDGAVGAMTALQFKNKFDKEGVLKSSKVKSIGALVSLSAIVETGSDPKDKLISPFFGGMNIKGKMVPESKLPFDPNVVLKGGGGALQAANPLVPWQRNTMLSEAQSVPNIPSSN